MEPSHCSTSKNSNSDVPGYAGLLLRTGLKDHRDHAQSLQGPLPSQLRLASLKVGDCPVRPSYANLISASASTNPMRGLSSIGSVKSDYGQTPIFFACFRLKLFHLANSSSNRRMITSNAADLLIPSRLAIRARILSASCERVTLVFFFTRHNIPHIAVCIKPAANVLDKFGTVYHGKHERTFWSSGLFLCSVGGPLWKS